MRACKQSGPAMQIQMDYYTEPGSGNSPNGSGSKENSNFNKIPYTVFMLIPNDIPILPSLRRKRNYKYKEKISKMKESQNERTNLKFCHGMFMHIYCKCPGSAFVSLNTDPDPTFIIQIRIHGSGSRSATLVRTQIH